MPLNSNTGTSIIFDQESRQPQSQALKTLQDVWLWQPSCEQFCSSLYSATRGYVRSTEPRKKPYTLVCHDFKGGYLEDRYLQGGKKTDAYYFCRWECIDIFVYFSHHFVTIPPLGWICAAHKHGTMILGTIITEWDDGVALWSTVLASKEKVQQLATTLVDICQYHGFDGWLVNVENKIEESEVAALKEFVRLLTEECHRRLPGSKVLWYDSVTRAGQLKWQDQLNEENSMFFKVCDGIFLNYCWTPEKLAASKDRAAQEGRPFDVFVGIDVFGRGCPGGGGFNTREALQHAREQDLSAAIFAPGWVLETLGETDFDDNDCRFWAKLHDLCPLSDGGGLPLSSAFCQGHGDTFFCAGKDMTGKPWYNMSLQQRQPERTRLYGFEDPSQTAYQPSLNTCLSSAYLGGCSLELSAHLTKPLQTVSFRLFSLRARLDETLYCSYTYRVNSDTPCDVYLVLTFGSGLLTRRAVMGSIDKPTRGSEKAVECDSTQEPSTKRAKVEAGDLHVHPMTEEEVEPVRSSLWFHDMQEDSDTESRGQDAWCTRHFKVDTCKLTQTFSSSTDKEESLSIAISLNRPLHASPPSVQEDNGNTGLHEDIQRTSILLGHLQVFREQDLKLQVPKVSGISLTKLQIPSFDSIISSSDISSPAGSAGKLDASESTYLVSWDMEADAGVDYFNVYFTVCDSPSLVGHTATATFVTAIAAKFVSDGVVTLTVQPVLSATGLPPALSKCTSQSLPLPVGS